MNWPMFEDTGTIPVPPEVLREADILYKYMSHNRVLRSVSRAHISCLIGMIEDLDLAGSEATADIGCGDSFAGAAVKMNCLNVGSLVGLDVDKDKLTISREVYRQNGLDCSLVEGSIYELPFNDSSFDLVICTEVLEHVNDVPKALQELWRITRRYCLLSVPNDLVFRLANLARGCYIHALGNPPEHLQHFGPHTFRRLIKEYFTIERTQLPLGLWAVVLGAKRDIETSLP